MLEEEVQFELPGQVNAQLKRESQPKLKKKFKNIPQKAAAHVSSRSYCSSEDD
jgi:hypothetical protein